MGKTNDDLVDFARYIFEHNERYWYWYGCFGQVADESLYNKKKQQYPKYYTDTDFPQQYGRRVMDCVGLIKYCLWAKDPNSDPKYNSAQDKSAKGMYSVSAEKGTMSTFPNIPGTLVYKGDSASSIHHVGVYVGDGKVIEAKGHKYGIVKSDINSGWSYWGQCPYFEKTNAPAKVEYYPQFCPERIDQVFRAIGVEDKYIGNVTKRRPIAEANGLTGYMGSATDNKYLISLAKDGELIKPGK